MIQLNQKETDALLKSVNRNGSHSGEVYVLYRRPSTRIYLSYTRHNIISKTGCQQDKIGTFQLRNSTGTYEKTLYYFTEEDLSQNFTPKLVITSSAKDFEVRNLFSVSDFKFNETVFGNCYELEGNYALNNLVTINKFTEKNKAGENTKFRLLFKLKKVNHIKKVEEFFKSIRVDKTSLTCLNSFVIDGKIIEDEQEFLVDWVKCYTVEPRSGVKIRFLKSMDYMYDGVVEIVLQQAQAIQSVLNEFFEIIGRSEVRLKPKNFGFGDNQYLGIKPKGFLFIRQPYEFLYESLNDSRFKNGLLYEKYYYVLNGLIDVSSLNNAEVDFFQGIRGGSYNVARIIDPYKEIVRHCSDLKVKDKKQVFYVFDNSFLDENKTNRSFDPGEFVASSSFSLNTLRYVCVVGFKDDVFDNLVVPNVNILVDPINLEIKKVVENLNMELNIKNIKESVLLKPPQKESQGLTINNDSSNANYAMAEPNKILSE